MSCSCFVFFLLSALYDVSEGVVVSVCVALPYEAGCHLIQVTSGFILGFLLQWWLTAGVYLNLCFEPSLFWSSLHSRLEISRFEITSTLLTSQFSRKQPHHSWKNDRIIILPSSYNVSD